MTDVFISYSHKDFDYAHRLANELKSHDIDVWIDDRIDYGDEWPRTIQKNLAACRTFIVIMSTNAFNSMWVQNEVSYAQSNHKTIFPLLLEGEVWLSMASMQYVNVSNGEMPLSRFFEKVRDSLKQPSPHAQEGRAAETPAVQHTKERVAGTRKHRIGLFLAGILLVLAVVAGVVYTVIFPGGPTEVSATKAPVTAETPGTPPSVQFEGTAWAQTQTAAQNQSQTAELEQTRESIAETETERARAQTEVWIQTMTAQTQTAAWVQTWNAEKIAETQIAAWTQTQNAGETAQAQTAAWIQTQSAQAAQTQTAAWIQTQNAKETAQAQTAAWIQTRTALALTHAAETAAAAQRLITVNGTIAITDAETKTYQTFQIDESVRLDPMYREHRILIKNRCINGASVRIDLTLTLDRNDNATVYVIGEAVLLEGTNCVEKSIEKDRESSSVIVARDATRDWNLRLENSYAKSGSGDTADIRLIFSNTQQR